jgi:hypothetical protein
MYKNLRDDMYYCTSWTVAFFFAGMIWYVLDRQYCTRFYRRVYNLFHERPLEKSEVKGLIYGQKTSRKFVWAFIISTTQTGLIIWGVAFSLFNPLVEFLLWLAEIPIMVLGMLVGPHVFNLWSHRQKAFTAIDDIEAGKIHPTKEITDAFKEKAERARKSLVGFLGSLCYVAVSFVERYWPFRKKDQVVTAVVPEPQKAPEQEVDPRELIKKFTKGK